jgi:excisionase family DNA binding protein
VPHPDAGRFLTLEQVAEELNVSQVQATSLVRSGDLRAFKLGGRGQWRIGRDDLEDYVQRAYEAAERAVQSRRGSGEEGTAPA